MKIIKTITKEYEIEPLVLNWHTTVGKMIAARKRLGLTYEEYEKCFICDKQFEDDYYPGFVSVKTIGNMFVCHKCMDCLSQDCQKGKTENE
jgi:hypothetical protein